MARGVMMVKKYSILVLCILSSPFIAGRTLDEFKKTYGITRDINSQSFIHINKMLGDSYGNNLFDFTAIADIEKIFCKEEELNKAGYICLYHGQKSIWGLQQELTKNIVMELIKIQMYQYFLRSDFLFIQNPQHFLHKADQTALAEEHKKFMRCEVDRQKAKTLFHYLPQQLFVNLFLFGNSISRSCSSLHYFNQNKNESINSLNLEEDVFAKLNLAGPFYQQCLHDIKMLISLNEKSFKQGRLLQIAVPAQKIDEYVYIADSSANRRSILGITSINSLCKPNQCISDVLDSIQFVMPLTEYYALNPASDIKVIVYQGALASESIYKKYKEKLQQLAKKIAAKVIESNKIAAACKQAQQS